MKLAGVVVLFYPIEDVYENILSYAKECTPLIIWDNTVQSNYYINEESLRAHINIPFIYVNEGQNKGLAYAYNKAISIAFANKCTHLITMDQDSRFDDFPQFISKANELSNERLLIAPMINSSSPEPKGGFKFVSNVAQSGCIHPMQLFKDVGLFREDFFIGMVDVEMQLKAVEKDYKIYQVADCILIHKIGSGRLVQVFNKKVQVSDYSPLRHYYDSRNRILMWKEFPYDYGLKGKLHHFKNRLFLCLKILLFENNKSEKIMAIVRGTLNGCFNRIIPYE